MVTHPGINPVQQGLTSLNRREPVFPFGDSRTIKVRHSGGAQRLSSDEMGGLEPVIYLAKGARVMLTMNIWTKVDQPRWVYYFMCRTYTF